MTEKDSLVRELPKGLIQWYQFRKGARALFIDGGEECFEVLGEAMEEQGLKVDCRKLADFEVRDYVAGDYADREAAAWQISAKGSYDYIVVAGALERSRFPESFLKVLRGLLNHEGVLLIGVHNRLGIKYFCGDRDPFTGKNPED